MDNRELKRRFDLASELIIDSDYSILEKLVTGHKTEIKSDGSFVTSIDKQIESDFREELGMHFPDDAIIGEEFGSTFGNSDYKWTIDPIDGTHSLVKGVPLFGTMIGLLFNGKPVMGYISFPILKEHFYAIKGEGAFWKPAYMNSFQKISVSQTDTMANALFCYTDDRHFRKYQESAKLSKLLKAVGERKTWGDCYGHMMVARGMADIMIDPYFSIWDLVPIKIIVEEAGGRCPGDRHPDLEDRFLGISCNAQIFDQLRQLY